MFDRWSVLAWLNMPAGQLWAGRIVSGLVTAFMLLDGVMKVIKAAPAVEGTVKVGYPESTVVGIGIALTISTLLYMLPRTSILGAILLTGYLGGAVATNVRVSAGPLFIVLPVLFGALAWVGLWLRDARLRHLLPLSS
jgi:hypothetical protein